MLTIYFYYYSMLFFYNIKKSKNSVRRDTGMFNIYLQNIYIKGFIYFKNKSQAFELLYVFLNTKIGH